MDNSGAANALHSQRDDTGMTPFLKTLSLKILSGPITAGLLVLTTAPAGAQTPTTTAPPPAPTMAPAVAVPAPAPALPNDYGQGENWLCRPGRLDACTTVDLATTVVAPDGATRTEPFVAAAKPLYDCFYVYPTVSAQLTPNSDMQVTAAERNVVTQQFARFGALCRTFAPMYRQVTLAALRTAMAGKPNPGDRELAYRDVRDAWRHYLAHDNNGRGVVLIGHSQGTGQLTRLIREEIDGKPVQRRIISAILAGGQVTVAKGKDVGGDFQSMPLCRTPTQSGCVVAWNSFRAEIPPPADSRFGRAADPAREVACVNPAALAGGDATLHPLFPAVGNSGGVTRGPPDWTGKGLRLTTTFVSLPDLVHGECTVTDGAHYLKITLTPPATGSRARNFNGDIMIGPAVLKSWGLHMVDVNLVEGDLTALVDQQARAWLTQGN